MVLLQVNNISKKIEDNIIVDNISFEQQALQKIVVAGESGSGKTTLLKMITGHAQPTSGTILFDEEKLIGPEDKLLPGHKSISYLSQQYELLNHYRVEELLWFENKLIEPEAKQLFEICRINHLLQRKTNFLSGGEKQRIALCMLLLKQPKMLVLDEPFSNLDPIHTNTIKEVLNDLTKKLKITCLLTSHNPLDALSWADEILVIKNGKLVQQANPHEIYYKPVNEYVAGMFGKYNLLKPHIATLFGIATNHNDVMARPENFKIYKTGTGVKGVISKVIFCGSFYEAIVMVEDAKIVVRNDDNEWKAGNKIFIAIKQ